jgi:hypothetical protein
LNEKPLLLLSDDREKDRAAGDAAGQDPQEPGNQEERVPGLDAGQRILATGLSVKMKSPDVGSGLANEGLNNAAGDSISHTVSGRKKGV